MKRKPIVPEHPEQIGRSLRRRSIATESSNLPPEPAPAKLTVEQQRERALQWAESQSLIKSPSRSKTPSKSTKEPSPKDAENVDTQRQNQSTAKQALSSIPVKSATSLSRRASVAQPATVPLPIPTPEPAAEKSNETPVSPSSASIVSTSIAEKSITNLASSSPMPPNSPTPPSVDLPNKPSKKATVLIFASILFFLAVGVIVWLNTWNYEYAVYAGGVVGIITLWTIYTWIVSELPLIEMPSKKIPIPPPSGLNAVPSKYSS